MFTSQLSHIINSPNNYVSIVESPQKIVDDLSDILSKNDQKPLLVKRDVNQDEFFNDFKSRFMPVENFSLNPDNLNI